MVDKDEPQRIYVVWEGDSLDVLRDFPTGIKRGLGKNIQRLQEANGRVTVAP